MEEGKGEVDRSPRERELTAEIDQMWAALIQLKKNQEAIMENFYRMNARMMLHEAYRAAEEMEQPRIGH